MERIIKFTWVYSQEEINIAKETALSFNALNCIVKLGETISGHILLEVIVVSA